MSIIVFTVILLLTVFLFGHFFLQLVGWRKSFHGAIAWGMTSIFALLQIIAYPIYIFGGSFQLFAGVFSAFLILIAAMSGYWLISKREKGYRDSFFSMVSIIKEHPAAMLLFAGMMLLYLFRVFGFYYHSSDDAFYLARAMEVITQNKLDVSHTLVWLGIDSGVLGTTTDASTFEFLKAYLSYVSGLHVAVICKTGLLLVLFLAHFSALSLCVESLERPDDDHSLLGLFFLIIYIFFQFLSVNTLSSGTWMTNYLWQGKSLIPGLIFPLMLSICSTLSRKPTADKLIEWLPASVALLAGLAVSVSGMILVPLYYFFLGVSFFFVTKWASFRKRFLNAVVTALPVLIIGFLTYFNVVTENAHYFTEFEPLGIKDWFKTFMIIDLFQLIFFSFGCLYLMVKGSRTQKYLLVLPSVIQILTFSNPLFIYYVSTYLTTASIYWRLFWIIPVYFVPTYAAADFFVRTFKGKIKQGVMCMLILFGTVFCRDAYKEWGDYWRKALIVLSNNSSFRKNIYNLTENNVYIANRILADWDRTERPVLLCEYQFGSEIRQYTVEIILAGGFREDQIERHTGIIPGKEISEGEFYLSFNSEEYVDDPASFHELLSLTGIDYVITRNRGTTPSVEVYAENGLDLVCEVVEWDGSINELWRVRDNDTSSAVSSSSY